MGLSEIPPANLSGVRALHSVDFSEWARGKSQHAAVRAMADKWIRICTAIGKTAWLTTSGITRKRFPAHPKPAPTAPSEHQVAAAAEKSGPSELKILSPELSKSTFRYRKSHEQGLGRLP